MMRIKTLSLCALALTTLLAAGCKSTASGQGDSPTPTSGTPVEYGPPAPGDPAPEPVKSESATTPATDVAETPTPKASPKDPKAYYHEDSKGHIETMEEGLKPLETISTGKTDSNAPSS